jgi:hypothetical protein
MKTTESFRNTGGNKRLAQVVKITLAIDSDKVHADKPEIMNKCNRQATALTLPGSTSCRHSKANSGRHQLIFRISSSIPDDDLPHRADRLVLGITHW